MRGLLPLLAFSLAGLVVQGQAQWTITPLEIKPAGDDFAPVLVDS